MPAETPHPPLPTRLDSLVFLFKSKLLQARRFLQDSRAAITRHPHASLLAGAPVLVELRSGLWNESSSAEFGLKAGKVQNLRAACRLLDGVEIPAGQVFSFWKQLGRTTRGRGYTTGRELRSGCLVPNLGGGLCALSGMLYEAALASGCEIIERHGHSKILPGMTADPARDATIFWNYVDLRFRVPRDLHIEARLDASHLILRFRGERGPAASGTAPSPAARGHASGDCLTCGETNCFRHPSANAANPSQSAHTAFLLDAFTPEFNAACIARAHPGDRWFLPLDHKRWKKPNYAWTPPPGIRTTFATLGTLRRARLSRRLPAQGPIRQNALLEADQRLAKYYADHLDPCAIHLVISQNLLPHLARLGALGGRSYDVLIHRLPLTDLHQVLDEAAHLHPSSKTLSDFRADPAFVKTETDALQSAARFITPHRDLARRLGRRASLADWSFPPALPETSQQSTRRLFLPCSPLARKGIYELAEALRGLTFKLIILGGATESGGDPMHAIQHRQGSINDLAACDVLILPAWVEHQPRLALLALASGIPVIATSACGLPQHPLLHEIPYPDPQLIRQALDRIFLEKAG